MNNDSLELTAVFYGKVQKVGFRWTIVEAALKCHLTGVVKNLSNGSVEVHAVGLKVNLEKFINSLREESGLALIDRIECNYSPVVNKYFDFKIIY